MTPEQLEAAKEGSRELSDRLRQELKSREFREGYVEGHVKNGIARQIRVLREARAWSQSELAARSGMKQATIARLENPDYGRIGTTTLLRLAAAFDVALSIQFVSFPEFLCRTQNLSPDAFNVESYNSAAILRARNE